MTHLSSVLSPTPSKRPTAFTTALAASLSIWAQPAASEPAAGQAQYKVLQNISYEFGSKFTSGYFTPQAGKCLVTLMVAEKSDPEQPSPLTAARERTQLMALQRNAFLEALASWKGE